ncbi:MAG: hypothetical protein KDI45_01895 [Candidatus Accumulibacter sp.]|nr:hypothetical protein [Accumulibacter sp.]
MAVWRFALLNTLGAALWAALITAAGYAFGEAITSLLTDLKTVEEALLLAIVVAGLAFWLWRRLRAQRKNRSESDAAKR